MKDNQNEPQLSAEQKAKILLPIKITDWARNEWGLDDSDVLSAEEACEMLESGVLHFLATALEEQKQELLSEVEKLQEVWEKTFIDSKKEGNNGDIWRGGVLALGELQAKLNQLKGSDAKI